MKPPFETIATTTFTPWSTPRAGPRSSKQDLRPVGLQRSPQDLSRKSFASTLALGTGHSNAVRLPGAIKAIFRMAKYENKWAETWSFLQIESKWDFVELFYQNQWNAVTNWQGSACHAASEVLWADTECSWYAAEPTLLQGNETHIVHVTNLLVHVPSSRNGNLTHPYSVSRLLWTSGHAALAVDIQPTLKRAPPSTLTTT